MYFKDFFTLPNLLSFSRIIPLTPLLALTIIFRDASWLGLSGKIWFAIVAGTAFLTDYLDGITARMKGEVTEIGKVLDPLGDKIIFLVGFITMSICSYVPFYLVLLVVIRDLAILAGAMVITFVYKIKQMTPSRWLGAVYVNVLAITLAVYFYEIVAMFEILAVVTLIFLVLSFADYLFFFIKTILDIKRQTEVKFYDRIPK